MKNVLFFTLVALVASSFTRGPKQPEGTRYAFVTDTEWDKSLDQPGKNGYVNLTTEVVAYSCSISDDNIKYQYIDHYKAEEQTTTRERAFIGASGITSVWSYSSYDEAVESRRDWLARKGTESKRTIYGFYISCK
jgi:hypothetical protein